MTSAPEHLDPALRVEALASLLTERGLIDEATVENFIKTYEQSVGPMNGAKVVARTWTDPEYRARLLADGTAAIAELGFKGPQGEREIGEWEAARPSGEGWNYYECWLRALERLATSAGLVAAGDLRARLDLLAARPEGHDHRHDYE